MLRPLIAALALGLFACKREEPPPAAPPPPQARQEKSAAVAPPPEAHAHQAHTEEPESQPSREHAMLETRWLPPSREQAAQRNPLGDSAKVVAAGKALYARECASCHGAEGRGDGPEAATLRTKLADLNGEAVAHRSDGTLQWRIASGRGEMPAFAARLTETERWQLVAFLRSRLPRPAPQADPVVKK